MTITSSNPDLSSWYAKVGYDLITVVQAFNTSIGGGNSAQGNIFAATPELDSVILFGTGIAGLAGFALTRARARRLQG